MTILVILVIFSVVAENDVKLPFDSHIVPVQPSGAIQD
ncbi:hypothetical protein SpAn4DRAFT_4475 [Sporomusa ovata]|uniref:Uncharacterized protein n=1 Tax=Sporomusa ovata TaxID=2378 RepID=A0A0U1L5Y8_9FIRM|nr:hypothetical protein SpAn4DRAFT_4475 [Sporomusa ovata]